MTLLASTTRRSYTFAVDRHPDLYRTHLAVNAGVRVAVDLLLTIRAGAPPKLALVDDVEVRYDRMAMLTHSWFVVESADTPASAHASAPSPERLRAILAAGGIDEETIADWIAVATPIFRSRIREGAVWVDRRAAFEVSGFPAEAFADVVIGTGMLGDPWTLAEGREAASDLVQAMAALLSRRLGTGVGADFARLSRGYAAIHDVARRSHESALGVTVAAFTMAVARVLDKPDLGSDVRPYFVAPGHRSRTKNLLKGLGDRDTVLEPAMFEKIADAAQADAAKCARAPEKGPRPWTDALAAAIAQASGFAYVDDGRRAYHGEYAVMLDHAARRVAGLHSFVINAERERKAARTTNAIAVPAVVTAALDAYCAERAATYESGTYELRPKALGGWRTIVAAWAAGEPTEEARLAALVEQSREPSSRPGDLRLYEALAVDAMRAVWLDGAGAVHPEWLEEYVAAAEAARWRTPMLRHVDAHEHPAFVDFGVSRFRLSEAAPGVVDLGLVDRAGTIGSVTLAARSARFERDLWPNAEPGAGLAVARNERYGRLAAGATTGAPVEVAAPGTITNARLMADRKALARLGGLSEPERGAAADRLRWTLSASVALPVRALDPRVSAAIAGRKAVNTKRGTMVMRDLEGVPGLRVLGVDLGLRSAAACAVIETMSAETISEHARRYGAPPPGPNDRYWRVRDGAGRLHRYRRLAPDVLDGVPHAAPWGYVEQTWRVRLPGEDSNAAATLSEHAALGSIAEYAGIPATSSRDFSDVRMSALRVLRAALKRDHAFAGDLEKIAAAIAAEDAGEPTLETLDPVESVARVRAALGAAPENPDDAPLASATRVRETLAAGRALAETRRRNLRRALGIARVLVRGHRRDAGGLSLDRLLALETYVRLLVSFVGGREVSKRGSAMNIGARTRLSLERLREARTREIAARIIEAALGGSRSNQRTRATERRYAPVQVIAVELLDGLRPSVARPKKMNRLISTLRSADVLAAIAMHAELHGLYVRSVLPAYTTLLDGVTGAPGVTVRQVAVEDFLGDRWAKRRESARRAGDPLSRAIVALTVRWAPAMDGATVDGWRRIDAGRWMHFDRPAKTPPHVLVPQPMGPLFSADGTTTVDADVNAAVSIASAPVLERAWSQAWPYVLCGPDGRPVGPRYKGASWDLKAALLEPHPQGKPTNAWRTRDGWLPTAAYWAAVHERIGAALVGGLDTAAFSAV